jgi:multicomponent K+:H+ antiporter subunit E/multicomponent Na+:H+ antiporter subunit E
MAMRFHPVVIVRLLLRFAGHCLLSGIATARVILLQGQPPAGVVRLHFAPMSSTGAAVLGALVTLTPGSSCIDIDAQQREMLLHLLDNSAAEATLASIRRDFEQDLCRLFPEGKS